MYTLRNELLQIKSTSDLRANHDLFFLLLLLVSKLRRFKSHLLLNTIFGFDT